MLRMRTGQVGGQNRLLVKALGWSTGRTIQARRLTIVAVAVREAGAILSAPM